MGGRVKTPRFNCLRGSEDKRGQGYRSYERSFRENGRETARKDCDQRKKRRRGLFPVFKWGRGKRGQLKKYVGKVPGVQER